MLDPAHCGCLPSLAALFPTLRPGRECADDEPTTTPVGNYTACKSGFKIGVSRHGARSHQYGSFAL